MFCIPQAPDILPDGAADEEQVGATNERVADEEPADAVQEQRSDPVPNMYSTVAELMAHGVGDEDPADVVQKQGSDPVPGRAPYIPTVAELMASRGADEKLGAAGSYRSRRTSATASGANQPLYIPTAAELGDMHGHKSNNSDRDNVEDNASLASESLSSISDNTDMFHAEVLDEESMTWTTEQDMETRRVEHLAQYLRAHPLLPPDPQDATKDWLDATSGIKFPAIHCAFSGCAWTQDKSSAHYDDALLSHLRSVHFNPNEPQSELWRSIVGCTKSL